MEYKNKHDRRIGVREAQELARLQNSRCMYCGRRLIVDNTHRGSYGYNSWNVEHFIPKAILKWTSSKLNKEEYIYLNRAINSPKNLGISCCKCNTIKNEALMNEGDIDKLYTTNKKKKGYKQLLVKFSSYIDIYNNLKEEVYKNQKHRCACCGSLIGSIEHGTLRRIDITKQRDNKNVQLVCKKCNKGRGIRKEET